MIKNIVRTCFAIVLGLGLLVPSSGFAFDVRYGDDVTISSLEGECIDHNLYLAGE